MILIGKRIKTMWLKQFLIVAAFFTKLKIISGNESEIYFYQTIENCSANEFYNFNELKCQACETNLNLSPHPDGLSCICDTSSINKFDYDNILQQPVCEKKTTNTSIAIEKRTTSNCKFKYFNYLNYNLKTNNIQIYTKANETVTSCECNKKSHTIYNNAFCIPNLLVKLFTNFSLNLKYLLFFCYVLKNYNNSCDNLINLCVLSNYDVQTKNSSCYMLYVMMQTSNINFNINFNNYNNIISNDDNLSVLNTNNYNNFPKNVFYKKSALFLHDLQQKFVQQKFQLNHPRNSTINLVNLVYNLNSSVIKIKKLMLNDFNLCASVKPIKNNAVENNNNVIKFGRNYVAACKVNLNNYVKLFDDVRFYELFINYHENNQVYIKSIPVLIENIFSNQMNSTDVSDKNDWQFVKRFLMIDTITGLKQSSNQKPTASKSKTHDNDNLHHKFNFLRYTTKFKLEFNVNEAGDKIATPILYLEYDLVNFTDNNNEGTEIGERDEADMYIDFKFEILFKKNYNFNGYFEIIIPILTFLSIFGAIIDSISYKIRQNKLFYDYDIFLKFFIQLLSNMGTSLYLITIILCFVIFVMDKSQDVINFLLPLSKETRICEIFICIALVLKMFKVVEMFYQISNIDIFFIDWERPKIFENHQMNMGRYNLDTPSISSGSTKPTMTESVSAWRNYFIANEWQELTTKRKISIYFHLIFVCLAFIFIDYENCTSLNFWSHSESAMQNIENHNVPLQIAMGVFIYTTLYVIQRTFNFIVKERFIENCIQQFIDVCSIANISVFILFLKSFGFYIHGRSPHGFSDTDMCAMIIQFKREENNLCGHRGLMIGSEQQTYSLLAPINLRVYYDKLIKSLQKPNVLGLNKNSPSSQYDQYPVNFEKIISAYYNINRFFSAFMDHALKDLDYIIKERTIVEWLLDVEIDSNVTDSKGIFYIDNGHSFDQCIFYGNENLIFQFEIILYTFLIVLTSGNYILSIIIVGMVYKLYEIIVRFTTKNNLAQKTLIDKRFLI